MERGKGKVGEEIEIVGLQKESMRGRDRRRDVQDAPGRGQAGDHIGVLLRGVERRNIERGMVLAKTGSIKTHMKFKGEVYICPRRRAAHTPFS